MKLKKTTQFCQEIPLFPQNSKEDSNNYSFKILLELDIIDSSPLIFRHLCID